MNIFLGSRTVETVSIYFEKANTPAIQAVLPQKAKSLEEALEDYQKTLLPNAASYGKTVWAGEIYIGDIWCYCIDKNSEPNAMLSYCIFEESYLSQGIGTKAVALFLQEIQRKFAFKTIGAFTFSDNIPSIRVLEKNGFMAVEELKEAGRPSKYFQFTF